jgi:hypothetical protein
MKKITIARMFVLTLSAVLLSSATRAQNIPRPSPPATATGTINGATITINYSSPAVKGRTIWDSLVPYNKPGRAGANEATIFTTDKDIKVEGKTLPAGKYSLFATPAKKEWTFIFNSQTGQWGIKRTGEANFDPSKNVITVEVKSGKSTGFNERLVYIITNKGFELRWENLAVPVKIK